MTPVQITPLPFPEDPPVVDWANIVLPDGWPDHVRLKGPVDWFAFLRGIVSARRQTVRIEEDLPGRELIPKYVLQEFHNLPNGNYSKHISGQYILGFDRAMLGKMAHARDRVASQLAGRTSILDIGCGGGGLGASCIAQGAEDVWGLDPSPYLLQHAACAFPEIRFVQGVVEDLPFADARFDGVAVCFAFHEIPPRYVDKGLAEIRRVLGPWGLLAICEPSPIQMTGSLWQLLRQHGLLGIYFHYVANFVFEPFVRAWHVRNLAESLAAAGLELMSDIECMPVRHVLARKRG